ncbi:hypothetical protein UA32_12270 [Photobacterium angustum]|uniref:Uncharacterized protein n=1 Tax=Photobacterium angustum TaxID=661 RepID=A0ABX5GYW7_PHOAN|nr:hypothetical protein [Photobacterium angustum]KJG37727.1 hypothetical protein UA32_12270 [Photobacterium angustum]PSX03938.1 hypothetical protein C0W27_20810 [Photobacterium angustum]
MSFLNDNGQVVKFFSGIRKYQGNFFALYAEGVFILPKGADEFQKVEHIDDDKWYRSVIHEPNPPASVYNYAKKTFKTHLKRVSSFNIRSCSTLNDINLDDYQPKLKLLKNGLPDYKTTYVNINHSWYVINWSEKNEACADTISQYNHELPFATVPYTPKRQRAYSLATLIISVR